MRSPQEQEEYLDHGRFGEGEPEIPRTRGPFLIAAGLFLILAGGTVYFSPSFHLVHEIMTLVYIVGAGSIISATMCAFDRTGVAPLVSSGAVFAIVAGLILFLPVDKEGFGIAGGIANAMLLAGSVPSAILGLGICAFGVAVDGGRVSRK